MAMACPRNDSKIFVGGLSWTTDAARLRSYFSNWGEVSDAFVSYDRDTGRPRGFGFVVFSDPRVADRVISLQHTVDRREVEAKKAVPKVEQAAVKPVNGICFSRTKKIFVGGLAPTVDETVFRNYFEKFGEVEDAVVMYDHDNKRPRGFGFITFVLEDSVDQVLLQGNMQTLHDKPIEIKRAVPREQMPAGVRTASRPASSFTTPARPFPTSLAKSAGFSLADVSLPATGISGAQGAFSLQALGPRMNSLNPGSLGIPAVRTPSGLAEYNDLVTDGLGPGSGLDLLLSSQQHGPGLPGLGSLGLDDLALLQNPGLAASMGHSPTGDIAGAQSLPSNLEEVLQGLQLGQGVSSRHHSGLVPQEALGNSLLGTTPGTQVAPPLGAFDQQTISAGQHW